MFEEINSFDELIKARTKAIMENSSNIDIINMEFQLRKKLLLDNEIEKKYSAKKIQIKKEIECSTLKDRNAIYENGILKIIIPQFAMAEDGRNKIAKEQYPKKQNTFALYINNDISLYIIT